MKRVHGTAANPAFTDAVRYWEPRRVVYNAVLALIVAIYIFRDLPRSVAALNLNLVLAFIFLAVAANVLCCTAYIVDVFLQYTDYSETWRRFRGILFVTGLVVAMTLAKFVAEAIFEPDAQQAFAADARERRVLLCSLRALPHG